MKYFATLLCPSNKSLSPFRFRFKLPVKKEGLTKLLDMTELKEKFNAEVQYKIRELKLVEVNKSTYHTLGLLDVEDVSKGMLRYCKQTLKG